LIITTENSLEVLPIPFLQVGFRENTWLHINPKAISFWEKAQLEPYSIKKPITYFVLFPNNEQLIPQITTFFRELSCIYEVTLKIIIKKE
jgi:hypothetical protein